MVGGLVVAAHSSVTAAAPPAGFKQTNLVAWNSSYEGKLVDHNLTNSWGWEPAAVFKSVRIAAKTPAVPELLVSDVHNAAVDVVPRCAPGPLRASIPHSRAGQPTRSGMPVMPTG